MLQNNSFLEDEFKTEEETEESSSNEEELPYEIIDRPQSKLCTFDGGLLIVWGCGEFGQHGHGYCEDVPITDALVSPLWLGKDRVVVEVACGSSHTLVLTDDNKIYSWGNSNSGQLGVGSTETSPHPRLVHLGVSSGTKLTEISCGTRHSFVWTQDGDCFSFGNNYSGQLGYDFRKPDFKENQLLPVFVDTLLQRSVSQVACGARHSVFLFTNRQVAAVGVNNRGQIGCGDTVDVICPKTVPDLPPISVIACGNSHSIAADVHGGVHVWGYSKACGAKTDVLSPVHVFSSSESNGIQDLAGGDSHSMILTSDGILYSWGNNFEGQLGHGKSVKFLSNPTKLSSSLLPGMVISVSIGENTSAAVTDDGKLYLWGKNASQIIRMDESSRFFQFEPFHVSLGTWKALKVSCGSWHVACIVCPNQNSNKVVAEIPEEIPGVETIAVQNEAEDSFDDGLLVLKRKQEADMKPKENFTWSDKETLASDEIGVSQDSINLLNQTKTESNQRILTGSDNTDSESHNTEQIERSCRDSYSKDFIVDGVVYDAGINRNAIAGADLDNPTVTNNLEEKPASTLDSKNEEMTDHVKKLVHEEKPATSPKVPQLSASGDPAIKGMSERLRKNLELGFVDRSSLLKHHYPSKTRDFVIKDKVISTISEALHDVKPLSSALTEPKTISSTNDFESKQPKEQTEKKFESSVDDEFDYAFEKFSGEPNRVEAVCEDEKEAVVESKDEINRVTRPRACSEQRSGEDALVSEEIKTALRSGSLDSLKLHHQQDDAAKDFKPSRVRYSPPAHSQSPVGHLNREKRPARMLRYTSVDMEYHLPNQPVHTVEIGVTPYYRPRPPMNRTQSSPTLYSSNLIGSPLGSRRKNSLSAKIPKPPTSSVNSGENLPPRPPARAIRRPLGHRPMFSSGNSWRKRK